MFRSWLKENEVQNFDYSGVIFPRASDREFWDPKFNKDLVDDAEQYLGFEWPLIRATDYIAYHTEGNRVKQETPNFKKRSVLIALLIGEIMEHKNRFIPDIVDGVFNICEETFWGVSAHYPLFRRTRLIPDVTDHYIDLYAAETGALIAIILYTLRDELYSFCPEIVERMEYELDQRIVKQYLKHDDYTWMGNYSNKVNNWNPWILANILTVFLLGEQSMSQLHIGIKKMIYEINAIYKSFPEDGGCDEGISYWSVSGGAIFEFCEQLYRATNGKINFFNDNKIKKIGDYPYKTYIGNNFFVNFADGDCKGAPSWKSMIYGYGKRTHNPNLCSLAKDRFGAKENSIKVMRSSYVRRAIFNIIYGDTVTEDCDLKLCESAVLPNIENAFARNEKWYYAAKGGHNNENHNHNDVGSFIAYYDCNPVLVDPGRGVYTKQTFSSQRYEIWTMRSEWHNLPVVNGKQQKDGEEYRTEYFKFSNKTCQISFAKVYDEAANIKELTRQIYFVNDGIEITDKFEFETKENTIAEHFITPLDVVIKENFVIIDGRFLLCADCDMQISIEKQDFFGDERLTSEWKTDSMNRIIFSTVSGEKKNIKFNLRRL